MGLNLESKKAIVAEVSAQVASAQTIVVAEYRGIEVGAKAHHLLRDVHPVGQQRDLLRHSLLIHRNPVEQQRHVAPKPIALPHEPGGGERLDPIGRLTE